MVVLQAHSQRRLLPLQLLLLPDSGPWRFLHCILFLSVIYSRLLICTLDQRLERLAPWMLRADILSY